MNIKGVCFCSLALGRGYNYLAKQLASDLARFAPGTRFLVLTDHPAVFKSLDNVEAVHHRKRSVLGYNDKLCVIREALTRFSTVVFIDADTRILAPVTLRSEIFIPGLRAFIIRRWSFMLDTYDRSAQGPWWQKSDLERMTLLAKEFSLPDNGRDTPFIVEFLFSITRGDGVDTQSFLQEWGDLAEFSEMRGFFNHLGFSMGLAAQLTHFPVDEHDFAGIKFFEPLVVSRAVHVKNGSITEEECDVLEATIRPHKDGNRKSGFQGQPLREVITKLRHLKIRLFGLNLLSSV